jgi:hypothetical protein
MARITDPKTGRILPFELTNKQLEKTIQWMNESTTQNIILGRMMAHFDISYPVAHRELKKVEKELSS